MAGHSKWANIKHKKAAVDAKRGKIFTRLIKEITVAARLGGKDITGNPRLRMAFDKARSENMPIDTIERAIKRGAGELEGVNYEDIRYEGYGPCGVPIMVDCLTDNRTRTVAEVRHAFSKNGGNLGTDGSVAYLFNSAGSLILAPGADEAQVFELSVGAGAEDLQTQEDGSIEITTTPENFLAVKSALENAAINPDIAEIIYKPLTPINLSRDDALKVEKLLEALESLDDVQNVYSALEND